MRYLGNKTRLLEFIDEVIKKHNIEGEVFADLFAGTGSVGDFFKDKYTVFSNDFLYYSFVLNRAKLMNSTKPLFETFFKKYGVSIFDWLNNKTFHPNKHYFIYNNYTPIGDRMFFTEENGLKIDGIRITIEELYRDQAISENEYFYLIGSLLESVTKVSNTSGTYEAFFKFWESRAAKVFTLDPLDIKETISVSHDNQVFNTDTNQLARQIEGDIAYIDTPYTVTQYASAYHVLETIARYDFPVIKGIGGKRSENRKVSLYSRKQLAKSQFEDLLRQLNFKHILISYSNQGLVPLEELVEIARLFALDNKVDVEIVSYKEYKNHRSSNKRNGSKLEEVIIYFKKDLTYNKSPLNYSGSKDTLLSPILKELPEHVGTFVDTMGGAFNVGANVVATDKVIYNEVNPYVYEMIEWIMTSDNKELITSVEGVIERFKLEKKAKIEYSYFRDYYNNEDSSPLNLYVLHMYSFQNMIRFNNSQKFNTPIGISGYSNVIKNRIENFRTKTPTISLINQNYTDFKWENFPEDTVFYFDPPYFITSAAYNDGKRGMKGWDSDSEAELLSILTRIDNLGYKFMLSNVLYHKGKTNNLLLEWIQEHKYAIIDVGKSGWRYSKDEILVKNF